MEHTKAHPETRKSEKPSTQAIYTTGAKKSKKVETNQNFGMHKLLTEANPSRHIKTARKSSIDSDGNSLTSQITWLEFPISDLKPEKSTDSRGPLFKQIAPGNRNT